jgi:hypothetical protein
VKDLIDQLQKLDQNLLVMINNEEVTGVEIVAGKIMDGYFGKFMVRNDKSRTKAVTFTHLHELSSGDVEPSTLWT